MKDCNQSENTDRGILYVAFGGQWIAEAKRSIRSLKRVSNLPVAVLTDSPWDEHPQPDQFLVQDNVAGFSSKPKYILDSSPFEYTLFLDTDTLLVSDPEPIFGLLKHYEIGVRFGGPKLNEAPNLEFHTQCNSGVILFKKCENVKQVAQLWQVEYERGLGETSNVADSRGLGDQRYLAIAIAKSKARPVHLEAFLNFTLFNTISTTSPPIVLHGRLKDMEIIAAEKAMRWDNRTDWNARIWVPTIRGFLPRGVRRSDPILALALVLRRGWNDLKRKLCRVFLKAGDS